MLLRASILRTPRPELPLVARVITDKGEVVETEIVPDRGHGRTMGRCRHLASGVASGSGTLGGRRTASASFGRIGVHGAGLRDEVLPVAQANACSSGFPDGPFRLSFAASGHNIACCIALRPIVMSRRSLRAAIEGRRKTLGHNPTPRIRVVKKPEALTPSPHRTRIGLTPWRPSGRGRGGGWPGDSLLTRPKPTSSP